MKATIDLVLSDQAKTLVKQMPDIKEDDIFAWFILNSPIKIGGGTVIEYLESL